jgi:hypothetical protein
MTKKLTETADGASLDAWEKHEKVAMHFNDLILRIRVQALGGVAALAAIGGVLLKSAEQPHVPWGLIFVSFLVLLAFWIAIWVLDFCYYNRLLLGAVDSLLALEDAINSGRRLELTMSHTIERAIHGELRTNAGAGPRIFYSIVALVFLFGALFSAIEKWCPH